jgi:hypothetical protein
VLREYDRQESTANQRGANQQATAKAGYQALSDLIAQQLAGQQQAQSSARSQIQGAGDAYQQAVDAGSQQAQQRMAQDEAVRGVGLGGGADARLAQEAANAKARGQAGTQIALDSQASSAQSSDQFLRQIQAATVQQGQEVSSQLTAQLNNQLRDISSGRVRDLATAQQDFLKTLMDLRSNNQQLELAKQGILGDKAEAATKAAMEGAKLQQSAAEKAADRKLRASIAAASNQTRTSEGAKNRASAEKRAAMRLGDKGLTPAQKRAAQKAAAKRQEMVKSQVSKALGADPKDIAARGVNDFRAKLSANGISDKLSRQILADLRYGGGLSSSTVNAYKKAFGVAPPTSWKRKSKAQSGGFTGSLGDAIKDAIGG